MLDRRRRLTDEQREQIKAIYASGVCGKQKIAKQFGVSKATIRAVVDPTFAEKRKQYTKDNWKKYQTYGAEHNKTIRNTRKYKQQLYLQGIIKKEEKQQ